MYYLNYGNKTDSGDKKKTAYSSSNNLSLLYANPKRELSAKNRKLKRAHTKTKKKVNLIAVFSQVSFFFFFFFFEGLYF